jgi:tRNA(adenine34) deaminase
MRAYRCSGNCLKALNFKITSSIRGSTQDLDLLYFMREALREAGKALTQGEVPVGAIVVGHAHEILARDHNRCISLSDPTAHAEILAIRQASKMLDNYRLNETTIFVTIEPCPMCMGAIINARVQRLVFGALDPKFGASGSVYNLADDEKLHHKLQVIPGIMEEECGQIMRDFFRQRR